MTTPGVEGRGPSIDIEAGPDDISIRQQRPSLSNALIGMPVEAARKLVPTLLPICGRAQAIAGDRAIEAARGDAPDEARETRRELQSLHEQALAAAWRLCVDWPAALGEPPDMDNLKRVRQAETLRGCGSQLLRLMPGIKAPDSLDSLLDWVQGGTSIAARLARNALDAEDKAVRAAHPCAGTELVQSARAALRQEPFDSLQPDPVDNRARAPLEVGPLAMARDPLVVKLPVEEVNTTSRLLAQLLDSRSICHGLDTYKTVTPGECRWQETSGTGIGSALTARGPVFHRVSLDPDNPDLVASWRVLAPTDWHFSDQGAVATALAALDKPETMRMLILSYDPCAPWTLQTGGAHA